MSIKFPAETIKKTIAYFYLLSYSPPAKIGEMKKSLAPLLKELIESAETSEFSFYEEVIPEVCRRIVAFNEDSREPSEKWIERLAETASKADESPQDMHEFQKEMSLVARLPQRALPDNRLHRRKGCAFCKLPCHYGFFTLVSDPDFASLQEMLNAEVKRTKETQSAIRPVWHFALTHLKQVTGEVDGYTVQQGHLGNLSYCLLMLAMAKSRLALPEKQLKVYQAINQELIQGN
ncbi:MAG: hypothetical protein HN855_04405 [Anaerolineae bacterium]|nr:hypothetical protein [Anaerolineae bacterium]MBT7016649.1 hypothetical protein [Anaerolineae bacterium]MBT7324378.1 hypothetical protein [Anaerolineae bacterium]